LGRLGGAFAPAGTAEAALSTSLSFFLFFDLDAERFQELQILIADFELGIGGQSGDEGSFVGGFFALLADADGGFENQENIVTALFDAGDNFGDLFGIGERLVDGFAEFLHELFELLIQLVPPDRRLPGAIPSYTLDARGGRTVCRPAQACAIVAPEAVKIEAVSKVSTARKLGAVARVASQQAKRSRTVQAATRALSATGRAFGGVLHQLWLEVTGLVFLVIAASGGFAVVKEYAKYEAGRAGLGRVVVAICFTVTFAWFGVSSFWRVRQKSRGGAR
jgi:hypothetical protein